MERGWLSEGFHGVMVSTLDSESSDPSSNLGGTFLFNYQKDTFYSPLRTCFPAPATPSGVAHTDPADRCGTTGSGGVVEGPAPLLPAPGQGRSDPARGAATQPVPPPRRVPWVSGVKGRGCAHRVLTREGASHRTPCNCAVVPVRKRRRGGAAMSLISQDGSFRVEGSRPDWDELCFIQILYHSEC